MIKVYKIPSNTNVEVLKTLSGSKGTKLKPIQDKNDNWIISVQEWDSQEFQSIRAQYPSFTLINYIKK